MMASAFPELANALDESADLAAVCRARELPGIEILPGNEFYGGDRVLKLYAELPLDRPLKLIVPHGIVLSDSYVWQEERRALLPAVLAYSDSRLRAYARGTNKAVFRSAVPFAYAMQVIGTPHERRGTLFFPSHSTHHLSAQADFEGMADTLLRLDAHFRPVTACLYWRDYELGRHRPFVERGLRVVSAGHIYDPVFLFRLAQLLSLHRYAASNHVSSSLFYSVIAGCRFFLLPDAPVSYVGSDERMRSDMSVADASAAEIAAAFSEPGQELSSQQRGVVASIAGLDHLLDPEAMRDCLATAERIDRYGLVRARGGQFHVAVPTAFLRAMRALARPLKRWAFRPADKRAAAPARHCREKLLQDEDA